MKAKYALQFVSGVTIMLSTFMLLLTASQYKTIAQDVKYALGSTDDFSIQTSLVQQTARVTAPPQNIVEGFFDINREGDMKDEVVEDGEKVVRHYRAIHSDQIATTDKKPTLKLQVYDKQQQKWVVTEITKIDKEDGTVYFLLKTEDDEEVIPNQYYTGTYQLIFN
jgi:hypothetical protein